VDASADPSGRAPLNQRLARHRGLIVTAFVGAVVAQCVLLYLPGAHGPSTGLPLDKVVHFTVFALVAALGIWARIPVTWLVIGLVGQAVVSELVQQYLLADRGGEVGDVVADLLGVAAGVLAGSATVPRGPATCPDSGR
jgi:hypothetical protein